MGERADPQFHVHASGYCPTKSALVERPETASGTATGAPEVVSLARRTSTVAGSNFRSPLQASHHFSMTPLTSSVEGRTVLMPLSKRGADLVSGQGYDEQPEDVGGPRGAVDQVDAERRLPIGSGRGEAVAPAFPECDRQEEPTCKRGPWYSRGIGGMRTQASSLMSDTMPSTSPRSNASTSF